MSSLNTDNVTVSLSRLALAKAIKTPDEGETEAEPWTKSVIFHQSHVSDSMRQSMLFPNQPRSRQQHHRQSRHLQDQGRPMGARRRSRSSSQLLDQYQYQQQQQQQQHHHQPAYQQQHGYQQQNQTQQYHSQQHQEPITTTATTNNITTSHAQQRSNRQSDTLMRPSSQERNRGMIFVCSVSGFTN